jgi:DNA-binding FadR family transcriptional regulator
VITEPAVFRGLSQVLSTALVNEDDQRDLFGMRLVLETGQAELVFLHNADDDVKTLRDSVEKEEKIYKC